MPRLERSSRPARTRRQASGVEVGVRVHLRDVETIADVADVTAPAPVEPGDLVASAEDVYCVEVVLVPSPDDRVVPVLARRVELAGIRAPAD